MLKASVNRRCPLPQPDPDLFDCGSNQRYGAKAFGPRSDFLSGGAAEISTIEALQRLEEVFEELRAERVSPLRRLPIKGFRFGIARAHIVEAGDRGLRNVEKTRRRIFAEGQKKLRALVRAPQHSRRDQRGNNRGGLHVSEHVYRSKQGCVLRAVIA